MAHATLLPQSDDATPVKRSRLSLKWNQQREPNVSPSLKCKTLFSTQQQDLSFINNNKENLPFDNSTVLEKNATSKNFLQSPTTILISESVLSQNVPAAGLPNCGNTCYVNSILQVLRYTPNFLNHLHSLLTSHKQLVQISSNSDSKVKEAEFLLKLQRLYTAMKKMETLLTSSKCDNGSVARPLQSFLKSLRDILPTFEEGEQHDAHELFLSILSTFDLLKQNNTNKVKTSFKEELPVPDSPVKICQVKSPKRLKRRSSQIDFSHIDLKMGFEGELYHAIKCLECENVTKKFEVFSNLEVAVADNLFDEDTVDLQECLIQYSYLSGENKYFCKICHHLNEASMYSRVVSLPSILLIHMSWLKESSDLTSSEKDSMRILIPLTLNTLENDEIFECSQEVIYNLYAVVLHLGNSSEGGHYISFVKETFVSSEQFEYSNETINRWLLFNDEDVSAITMELTDIFPYYDYLGIWASPCMIFYHKSS